MASVVDSTIDAPRRFSEAIRAGTWSDHQEAEQSDFIRALFGGRLAREGYVALTAQLYFVYRALEAAVDAHPADSEIQPLLARELVQLPALEQDLAFFLGPSWRDEISPIETTRAYVARIEAASRWPGGLLAHHYTRYLGDLSGGQSISRAAQRAYGLTTTSGAQFLSFDAVGDLKAFKQRYRELLDALPWSVELQQRVIDEVVEAYRLNTELFLELDRVPGWVSPEVSAVAPRTT